MASVSTDKSGNRRILFAMPDGKRPAVRLGKVSLRSAEGFKTRIEALLECLLLRRSMEADLAGWVTKLDARMAKRLAAVGLIPKPERKAAATLEAFMADYIKGRVDVKPATKEVWRQGEMGLVEFFGGNKPLMEITAGDADDYKLALIGKKLAPMTIRKRLQFAKMIFRAAVRRKLIAECPFADVSIQASMPNRERFITPEETDKLLAVCNPTWRVIVALARYGGLRCPSEVLSLRWEDVNWEADRINVQSPKTAHHPGKDCRSIPLFPELRSILTEAREIAPEGAVYVVDERMRHSAQGKAGWRNCNLRSQFERLIARAGLKAWPRLFHNLRSSRQTELAERFPSHVVCDWLGNSEDIARKHYYQTTDAHFAEAASDGHQKSDADSDARVAQNRAQHVHAENRGDSHQWAEASSGARVYAASCETRRDDARMAKRMGRDSNPR